MRAPHPLAFVVAACLAAACASERPARDAAARRESAPSSPAAAARACEARCDHARRCAPPPSNCACAESSSVSLRDDWTRTYVACLADPKCAAEDECETAAYRATGAAPLAWPPAVLACLQMGSSCGGSSAACKRLAAASDEARDEATRCFARPCDEFRACFEVVYRARIEPALGSF